MAFICWSSSPLIEMIRSTLKEFKSLILETVILEGKRGDRSRECTHRDRHALRLGFFLQWIDDVSTFTDDPTDEIIMCKYFQYDFTGNREKNEGRGVRNAALLCFILILGIFIHNFEHFSTSLTTIFLLTSNDNHSFLTVGWFVFIHVDSSEEETVARTF